jgi:hypothetical protein
LVGEKCVGMMEKRMKMVTKSKGFALGTRSQNYMAKVPPLDLTQLHQMTSLGRSLEMLMGPYLINFEKEIKKNVILIHSFFIKRLNCTV